MCLKEGGTLGVFLNTQILGSFSKSLNAFQVTLLINEGGGESWKQRQFKQFKHLDRCNICFLNCRNILSSAKGKNETFMNRLGMRVTGEQAV